MISDNLGTLADRIFGHATHNTSPSQQELAAIARELLNHARVVAVMETLPFEVSLRLLDALPEWPLIRAATQARQQ